MTYMDAIDLDKLASNMERIRNDAGYTMRKTAGLLGYDQRTYAKWEGGEKAPPVDALNAFMRIFKVNRFDLLT